MNFKTNQTTKKNIAIIGCGYISHHYMKAIIKNYPYLNLLGICDKDVSRAKIHSQHFSLNIYPDLESILNDEHVDIVVNLTSPEDHYEITKACLEKGKNVYSEKPLAMSLNEVKNLIQIAQINNVQLSSAPCSVLSETAQTIWKGIKEKKVGNVKLVYAEIDEGPLHVLTPMIPNKFGVPWPHKNEFKTGCTLEHAAYYVSWLTAFFGPVKTIIPFSTVLLPEKEVAGENIKITTPDFSCACLEFESGVVARLTNSILAPFNHRLQVIGDEGVITTNECWNYYSPCFLKKYIDKNSNRYLKAFSKRVPLLSFTLGLSYKKMKLVREPSLKSRMFRNPLKIYNHDFARGIAEMALSLIQNRKTFLSLDYLLHVHEIVFAIQNSMPNKSIYKMTTSFESFDPEHLIWKMKAKKD
ncbi:MAG: Gfo/Idh/MocA family oxidoreductase [Coleofasciculaceae cyanobacterium]